MRACNFLLGRCWYLISIVILVKREQTLIYYLLLLRLYNGHNWHFVSLIELVLFCKISWDYIVERVNIYYN